MFLEMTDKNRNEIILYSQNIFDQEENFKLIFKDQSTIRYKKITYSEANEFLSYPLTKNIILYRLITNYDNISSTDSKYGFILSVDGKEEFFYFDPVYALKDLPNLVKNFNLETFRFRIQQVGIKTLAINDEKESYTEIYCHDLHSIEAQNQNDKIFADALFQNDEALEEDIKEIPVSPDTEIKPVQERDDLKESKSAIDDDQIPVELPLAKPITDKLPGKPIDKAEQKELLKKILGIDNIGIIENQKIDSSGTEDDKIDFDGNTNFSDLFRSTRKAEPHTNREGDIITLKFTKF